MTDIGVIRGLIELTDNFTPQLEIIGNELKSFSSHIKEGIEDPIGSAKEVITGFLDKLGPAGAGILAIGTIAAAAGVGLFELAEHASEAGEKVLDFSRMTGAAVAEVGSLAAATNIGGSSLDSMQGMLFQMQRRMDATGQAAEKFNEALGDLSINATRFRSADPTERIALLSTAMHGAVGNTNLMSDAIALMGRGARENMPFLLKNFEELKEKGEAVAYQWSNADTKAAEEFGESTRELTQTISGMATAIGVGLLPIMTTGVEVTSRMVVAIKNVADAGGLFSGIYRGLKGVLGETALEEEKFAAVQDSVNKLWVQAGGNADAVAKTMLALGYSVETVVEQTGLEAESVKDLSSELKEQNKAADEMAKTWNRVNAALSGGNDIRDVDSATREFVKSLFDANVKIEDMVKVTNLSVGQLNVLKDGFKEAERDAKEFAKAWGNLNTLGATYSDTLAGVEPHVLAAVMDYVKLGASVGDLVKAFPTLTEAQAKAAEQSSKASTVIAATWRETFTIIHKMHGDNINDWLKDEKDRYDAQLRMLADTGAATGAALDAELAKHNAIVDAEMQKRSEQNNQTKGYYQKRYDDAKNAYDALRALGNDATADAVRQARLERDERERDLNHWRATAAENFAAVGQGSKELGTDMVQTFTSIADAIEAMNGGLDSAKIKVKTLGGELISLDEAQKRFEDGGSVDVTSANFAKMLQMHTDPGGIYGGGGILRQYKDPYALAKLGYSFAEIVMYAYDSTEQGPIPPPKGPRIPGMAKGGHVMVGENGPEILSLPTGFAGDVYPSGMTPRDGGLMIHVAKGAVVLNYPLMDSRGKDELGRVVADALELRMRNLGYSMFR
jgi:hypothetical protein